ncbi:MAG: FIST signal transduction protein [Thermomicrobiales bacterium]
MTRNSGQPPHRFTPAQPAPRAASALVVHNSWAVALEHATDQVISPGDPPPDVLIVFASPAFRDAFSQLTTAARQRTGAGVLIGCSASGFLAGETEVEDRAGLALMALWLPGARIHTLRLHQEHVELLNDPALWHDMHRIPPADVNSWLMFAEPFRIDAQDLIQGLQAMYPEARIMGGIASGLIEDRKSCVFFDDHVYDEGGVALGIGGPYSLSPRVSQGCVPIGECWTITGVEQNTLISISNRPALEVLQDSIGALVPEQRERAQHNLVVGLAVDEYHDRYGHGDFAIRGILGIDPKRGSVAIGGKPRCGQTIQFHLRDPVSADLDLTRMMCSVASGNRGVPIASILCTCDGRGQSLFGVPHHDATAVRGALPETPLVGAFCLGEIGPLGCQSVLHGFSATLGVLEHHHEKLT